MFVRGAFSQADAANAAMTLAAYAVGLLPFVLIRSVVASFQARKDTATPAKVALIGVGFNLAAKVALVGSLAQAGLALGTAIGAWVNLLLVFILAVRARYIAFDRRLQVSLLKFAGAGLVLALALWATAHYAAPWLLSGWRAGRDEFTLGLLIVTGAIVYPLVILLLFGRRWLVSFVRR